MDSTSGVGVFVGLFCTLLLSISGYMIYTNHRDERAELIKHRHRQEHVRSKKQAREDRLLPLFSQAGSGSAPRIRPTGRQSSQDASTQTDGGHDTLLPSTSQEGLPPLVRMAHNIDVSAVVVTSKGMVMTPRVLENGSAETIAADGLSGAFGKDANNDLKERSRGKSANTQSLTSVEVEVHEPPSTDQTLPCPPPAVYRRQSEDIQAIKESMEAAGVNPTKPNETEPVAVQGPLDPTLSPEPDKLYAPVKKDDSLDAIEPISIF